MHHNTLLSQCIFISRWFPTGKQDATPISIFQRQAALCVNLSNATFERSPAEYNETIGPKQKKCVSPQRVRAFVLQVCVEEHRLGGLSSGPSPQPAGQKA